MNSIFLVKPLVNKNYVNVFNAFNLIFSMKIICISGLTIIILLLLLQKKIFFFNFFLRLQKCMHAFGVKLDYNNTF